MKRLMLGTAIALMLSVLLAACGKGENSNNAAQPTGTVKVVGGSDQNP